MPFRDVIGHRRIVELLARSVARSSLPPSLIFAGPEGAGKRFTATALAQTVNCLQPAATSNNPTSSPQPAAERSQSRATLPQAPASLAMDACGRCSACTRIERGVHPDVLALEPGDSGSIKIEQVREAIDRAAYKPFEGKRRVIIIDHADALGASAQNALLKTLEEPPSSSIFILVTARPDVLLPTVRSRCIRLLFAEGARQEIDVESRDVARRVLIYAASTPEARSRIEGAKELLGNSGSSAAADRARVSANLRAMATLLRDAELLSAGADASRLANPDERTVLEGLSRTFHGNRGVRAFAAVDRALDAIDSNVGVKTVADWLVLEL